MTCDVDGYVTIGEVPPYQFKFEVSKCNTTSEWFYVREDYDYVNVVQATVAPELRPFVAVSDNVAIRSSEEEATNVPLHHWVILKNREGKSVAVYLADISGEGVESIHLLFLHGALAEYMEAHQRLMLRLIERIGRLERTVDPALEDIEVLKVEMQEVLARL